MKKLMLLCVLLILGGTVFGVYSYKVDGYVYDRFDMSKVSGATVKLKVNYGTSSSTQTKTSKSDGSYSFTVTSSNDPNGAAMSLTATSGSKKGGIAWKAESYSERKDCPVDSLYFDPTLRFKMGVAKFSAPGIQPLDTAFLYRDDLVGPPWTLASYNMQLAFDPTKVQCAGVIASPDFPSFSPIIDNGGGMITINSGPAATPIYLGEEDFAAPLFDIEWEVIDVETNEVTSVFLESSEFVVEIDGVYENFPAVHNQSDHLLGEPDDPQPYFLISNYNDWDEGLLMEWPGETISPVSEAQWEGHVDMWMSPDEIEGIGYFDPYPDIEFIPPDLFVYPGGDDGYSSPVPDPEDAGLIMTWGDTSKPDGNYAGAWHYDYGLDPDLSNCTIQITITAPQFGAGGQINQVSFDIIDVNGGRTGWWWSCGPGNPIPWNTPTTVTIDTTKTGIAATSPVATGWATIASAVGPFDIKKAQSFDVDENGNFVFGAINAPPPGSGPQFVTAWNYWHNLSVTPKLPGGGANSKWFVKWSQPPVEIEPGLIDGWDEVSISNEHFASHVYPIMADDWQCDSDRPVTDIHWWGSFVGWTQPYLPPIVPKAFHIGIWTDQPDPNPTPGLHGDGDWSHPLTLVWENVCDTSVWNFAGYDEDPRVGDPNQQENEACFQWAQFLSQDEWFHQEEGTNVYWLSIAAIYDPCDLTDPPKPDFYPWGWKTRPHHFNDDAVRIQQTSDGTWPPVLGSTLNMTDCDPIHIGEVSWDLAFELTTNEPAYEDDPIPGDITGPGGDMIPDGSVDIHDFAVVAGHWLDSVTP